jgi:hypothetical protein
MKEEYWQINGRTEERNKGYKDCRNMQRKKGQATGPYS